MSVAVPQLSQSLAPLQQFSGPGDPDGGRAIMKFVSEVQNPVGRSNVDSNINRIASGEVNVMWTANSELLTIIIDGTFSLAIPVPFLTDVNITLSPDKNGEVLNYNNGDWFGWVRITIKPDNSDDVDTFTQAVEFSFENAAGYKVCFPR